MLYDNNSCLPFTAKLKPYALPIYKFIQAISKDLAYA